jgi:DNA repair exonuclease SbcCD ATPase subunit
MKTIKSITATNFKGRSFAHELAPINIVTGPNDSGKTAVADAIRVGLLGYLPSLGKTAGATFQLAKGTAMGVRVDMNGGGVVSREWEMKKGRVSSKGADSGFPDMLFDLKPFFSLSAAVHVHPDAHGGALG